MASANIPLLSNRISSDVPNMNTVFQALLTGQTSTLSDLPTGAVRWVFNSSKTQLTMQYYSGSTWVNIGKFMHDADTLDGYHASTSTTANTVPVRNSAGQIVGNITGSAASAATASTVSGTVSISNGGTSATTLAQAKINLGIPSLSSSVTSTSTTIAANLYGLKLVNDLATNAYELAEEANNKTFPSLSNSVTSTSTTTAASSYAVNQVYNTANAKMTSFVIEDGDTTGVTIGNGKYVKFVEGGNIDINWTDTSTGSASDEYDLTFTVPSATTSARGCVMLSSSVTSTSQTQAATPYAVKLAYDRTTTAINTANTANSTANSKMTLFYMKDGDGTQLTISNAKYVKFVEGGNIDINFTDTSSGTSSDEYDLTFTVPNASTSVRGAVQLSNSTTSTSDEEAATIGALSELRTFVENNSGGGTLTSRTFTSSGTWTAPKTGYVFIHLIHGGGAGGNGGGAGGNGGGYVAGVGGRGGIGAGFSGSGGGGYGGDMFFIALATANTSYQVVVGAGGVASSGTSATTGGDGGKSSVSTLAPYNGVTRLTNMVATSGLCGDGGAGGGAAVGDDGDGAGGGVGQEWSSSGNPMNGGGGGARGAGAGGAGNWSYGSNGTKGQVTIYFFE